MIQNYCLTFFKKSKKIKYITKKYNFKAKLILQAYSLITNSDYNVQLEIQCILELPSSNIKQTENSTRKLFFSVVIESFFPLKENILEVDAHSVVRHVATPL